MIQKYDNSLILALLSMKRNLLTLILTFLGLSVLGQTRVQLKRAEKLAQAIINDQPIQKLIGNVWIVQGSTNIFCDSAYLNKASNSAQAFGHVNIIDSEDSIDVKSDYMEYEGSTGMAKLRENVILRDSSGVLYTDYLDYDRSTKVGYYQGGGKLIDPLNEVTSLRGEYYPDAEKAHFYDSVRVKNVDFNLQTDTMFYETVTRKTETKGFTKAITTEGDTLISQKGLTYDANKQYAEVYMGEIRSVDYTMKADTLIADDLNQLYRGYDNIVLYSVADSLTIFGDVGIYNKQEAYGKVYENAYLRKMIDGDSLFIKADTLFSSQKEEEKYLLAYHNTKLYKSNLQGIADSVSYNFSDSTIYMFQDPVIWSDESQISADSINIEIKSNRIDKMILRQKAFVISKDSLENFNQIKGRDMDVYFKNGSIDHTDINGNGESIYFVMESPGVTSMNKMKCSNMGIYFKNNFVSELKAYREIDGRLIPPTEILGPDKRLRGFAWRVDEKPKLREVVLHLRYDR